MESCSTFTVRTQDVCSVIVESCSTFTVRTQDVCSEQGDKTTDACKPHKIDTRASFVVNDLIVSNHKRMLTQHIK